MINRYQVMIISGILIILASSIPIYYSHWESAISYNHVNATTCIEVLDNIINGSLTGNRINEVIKSLDQSLLISIEVNIEYTNGSSVTYGYYTPIGGASGVAIAPMISGNIEIFGRTHCAYMGRDYVINVFIGQYVTALYLFGIGIALIIVGFVMIALGDYLKDKRNRRRFGQ